jgi:hypothetical protein
MRSSLLSKGRSARKGLPCQCDDPAEARRSALIRRLSSFRSWVSASSRKAELVSKVRKARRKLLS